MTLIIFITVFTLALLSMRLAGVELWTAIVLAAFSAALWAWVIPQIVGM